VPQGYDSIYCAYEQEGKEGEKRPNYNHTYQLFNGERVQLLHKVTCKIHLEEKKGKPKCAGPGEGECVEKNSNPIKYCKNDKAYFCDACDKRRHESHNGFDFKHEVINISSTNMVASDDFGKCSVKQHAERGKENEYFCHCCNKAYCSQCLLEGLSTNAANKSTHKLIDIQTAYNDSKEEAVTAEDITLQSKKELIEHYMGCIKFKMGKIQTEATEI
jgi:hypothetical protein